ncbi:hypothetical protein [Pedobacter sp. Hv1]|uniref:hypothetical protein n=1 Tax=Pedobacter sp. Hv1 TaxID=1740090 RepID=UPI0006D89458|nr:hypothetical protein [Pedobacter sp. Hv1]
MKKYIICLALGVLSVTSFAQSTDAKQAYLDFTIYRTNEEGKATQITQTLALLKLADQLSAKQITNINYHLGRMYEDVENPEAAIPYYEKSVAGEPNYLVVHRALGFIFLTQSKPIVARMEATTKAKDVEGNKKAYQEYKTLILKAIPHLEKYQACDPDDDTLKIIIDLYKSIKDTNSINTLPARLKQMGAKCVDLLDDE